MRSTIFGKTDEVNPNTIFDTLISNLQLLIKNKCVIDDSIPLVFQNMLRSYFPESLPYDQFRYGKIDIESLTETFEKAILGLKRLRDTGNPKVYNPQLNQAQINAMLSIPAIVRNWDMMMKYKPLQSMNDILKELTIEELENADKSRLNEIAKLQKQLDQLNQERGNIAALKGVVNNQPVPVKELADIKKLIERVRSGKHSADTDDHFCTQICKAIATSKDPEMTFQQTYSIIKTISFPGAYVKAFRKCEANKAEFERFFGQYGYEPTNATSFRR